MIALPIMGCSVFPTSETLWPSLKPIEETPVVVSPALDPHEEVIGLSRYDKDVTGISSHWYLHSIIDKRTLTISHRLDIDLTYFGSRIAFEESRIDGSSGPAPIEFHSGVLECAWKVCELVQDIEVPLDDAMIRARAPRGFDVEIDSRSGSSVSLVITPEMLAKQLASVDQLLHSAPPQSVPMSVIEALNAATVGMARSGASSRHIPHVARSHRRRVRRESTE